jgi:hypothetical protein
MNSVGQVGNSSAAQPSHTDTPEDIITKHQTTSSNKLNFTHSRKSNTQFNQKKLEQQKNHSKQLHSTNYLRVLIETQILRICKND